MLSGEQAAISCTKSPGLYRKDYRPEWHRVRTMTMGKVRERYDRWRFVATARSRKNGGRHDIAVGQLGHWTAKGAERNAQQSK